VNWSQVTGQEIEQKAREEAEKVAQEAAREEGRIIMPAAPRLAYPMRKPAANLGSLPSF
jgi:hypothetical protein